MVAQFYFRARIINIDRTGASHVHIVSHMCRRNTFADAQDDAKIKSDTEFVTKNNPAVRTTSLDISHKPG